MHGTKGRTNRKRERLRHLEITDRHGVILLQTGVEACELLTPAQAARLLSPEQGGLHTPSHQQAADPTLMLLTHFHPYRSLLSSNS